MSIKKIIIINLFAFTCLSKTMFAFAPTNFFKPHHQFFQLPLSKKTDWTVGIQAEFGQTHSGRDELKNRKNILTMHNNLQSTLAMIKNACNEDVVSVYNNLPPTLDDDGGNGELGYPGYQSLKGTFRGIDVTLYGSYKIPFKKKIGTISFSFYLPIVKKDVFNVTIKDLTDKNIPGTIGGLNKILQDRITNNLVENVAKWGCLNLCSCNTAGIGDITLIARWQNQNCYDNKNQDINVLLQAGVSFPTGNKKNEDKVFSMALGNETWGIPFGLGLNLNFNKNFSFGTNADFTYLFNQTRNRRMKTHKDQTIFLLLNTGRAKKEYGFTWKINSYIKAHPTTGGLSAQLTYQFTKHNADKLSPKTNVFDQCIVNTAENLRSWYIHELIFSINYDWFKDYPSLKLSPQIRFFYKLPIIGKNIVDSHTFGGQFALNF